MYLFFTPLWAYSSHFVFRGFQECRYPAHTQPLSALPHEPAAWRTPLCACTGSAAPLRAGTALRALARRSACCLSPAQPHHPIVTA